MSWDDKILEGMQLIREGCRENKEWSNCSKCPFDECCDKIMKGGNDYDAPSEWDLGDGTPDLCARYDVSSFIIDCAHCTANCQLGTEDLFLHCCMDPPAYDYI